MQFIAEMSTKECRNIKGNTFTSLSLKNKEETEKEQKEENERKEEEKETPFMEQKATYDCAMLGRGAPKMETGSHGSTCK